MKTAFGVIGVYAIKNKLSGRIYVGSSINIHARWSVHRTLLRQGKHHSLRLQRSWSKHGEINFEFTILEDLPSVADLPAAEQKWIDHFSAACPTGGFNVLPLAGTPAGRQFSLETREKMRLAQLGRKQSPETIAARSNALKGHAISASHKQVWSFRGKRHSEESRQKMSASKKGTVVSEATRAKISAAQIGRKRPPFSDEWRANIAKAVRARLQNDHRY